MEKMLSFKLTDVFLGESLSYKKKEASAQGNC